MVDDELFDDVDVHGLAGAVGGFAVPSGADEVGVNDALLVLRVGDEQPGFAVAAVQRPFEVVVVGLGLVACEVVGLEYGLDLFPRAGVDEWFMLPFVLDVLEYDRALVVRVLQSAVQGGDVDRLCRTAWCGCGDEAADGEFIEEGVEGPVAGGVGRERPGDQWRPVGVGFHGA
nr:hypothetical protein [uncultured Microbacterium sp.]